jgi:hypothetical protein
MSKLSNVHSRTAPSLHAQAQPEKPEQSFAGAPLVISTPFSGTLPVGPHRAGVSQRRRRGTSRGGHVARDRCVLLSLSGDRHHALATCLPVLLRFGTAAP